MAFTFREDKGSDLTPTEVDENFREVDLIKTFATSEANRAEQAANAAAGSEDSVSADKLAAQAAAQAAATSESNAAASENTASAAATNAATSENNADSSATTASNAATIATDKAADAEQAAIDAQLAADSIRNYGLGANDTVGVVLMEEGGNGGTFAHINRLNQFVTIDPSAFDKHRIFGGIKDVVIDGQDMVLIPKFYIKTESEYFIPHLELKRTWLISPEPALGFRVHPAFMKNGAEIDQIYVGKYQASLEDGKLASIPGVLPAVSRSLTSFTADALARNVEGVDGFMLWSTHQWSAIQFLFLVEHKTMDSQAAVGQGRVSTSSAAEVDAPDVAEATYRGITGLWGNVWQWCQGISAVNDKIRVWDTQGYQAYVDTPYKRADDVAEAIYPTTFFDKSGENYDLCDLFIGKEGNTSNTGATAPDYNRLRLGAGPFFSFVGGRWGDGSGAGLWALYVSSSAGNAGTYIGARLAKV